MLKKPIILPEGYPFIIVALLLGVVGLWMKWYYAAVVPFVLAVYFTYFFRCPPRNDKITPGDDVLVSPADGTVVDVCHDAKEDMFLGQTCHKITIFLSIFDVHCNRSPMEGKITYQSYSGKTRRFLEKSGRQPEKRRTLRHDQIRLLHGALHPGRL